MSAAWSCTCGFQNRLQNAVCGGTGPLGCKAERFRSQPAKEVKWAGYEIEETPTRCCGSLRLVTYNVNFHPADLDVRLQTIAHIFDSVDADIVALQEVTDKILQILSSHISKKWQIFKQSPACVEDLFVYESNYFTCLLVKAHLHVQQSFSHRFSVMAMAGRLQYVVLTLPEGGGRRDTTKVVVATSHLESPVASRSGHETREHQMQEGAGQGNVLRFLRWMVSRAEYLSRHS